MLYTIVTKETAPLAARGMAFHGSDDQSLVSVSPELLAMGCPNNTKAITWAAMNHSLTLVSRKQTRMISRTVREMTLTLKEA